MINVKHVIELNVLLELSSLSNAVARLLIWRNLGGGGGEG